MAQSQTQYQHFVPQFLLRNFAHDFVSTAKGKKKKQASYDKGGLRKYAGDKVVYNVNLKQTPYVLDESPVKRILGLPDMYNDNNKPTKEEQSEVESLLSRIENDAQKVFRRIIKAYESGDDVVSLSRPDRDLVRKFLFLLKFRGSGFHDRFAHETMEEYSANDKKIFEAYMRKNNSSRPIEVWLRSLKIFINLKMDPEKKWISEIMRTMYHGDAGWFVQHTQFAYMAICTPEKRANSEEEEEFIVSDNSYNVFEGPNHSVYDLKTGKTHGFSHANLHDFAPISSKIMILLRSAILPVPEEDDDPVIQSFREIMRQGALDEVFGTRVESVLQDLPIGKARNSYTHIVNGRVVPNSDFRGQFSVHDQFYFKFFPLKSEHVFKINKVLLENTYRCSRIVFGSQPAFLRTLSWFMAQPNVIGGEEVDRMDLHLQRLKALTRDLGLTVECTWLRIPSPPVMDFSKQQSNLESFHEFVMEIFEDTDNSDDEKKPKPGTFLARHVELVKHCSKKTNILIDWKQSSMMQTLRIKIDSWSRGVDEKIRLRNRDLLTEMYMQLPTCRFWLYMKRIRMMLLSEEFFPIAAQPLVQLLGDERNRDRPEDIFVDALSHVRLNRLNHLIHSTVMTETMLSKLECDIWKPASSWSDRVFQYEFLSRQALQIPGKIRDCGIPEIEVLAATCHKTVVRQRMYKQQSLNDPLFSDEDKIEIATRILVQRRFSKTKLATTDLEPDMAQRMKIVLFTYTYMTPPSVT